MHRSARQEVLNDACSWPAGTSTLKVTVAPGSTLCCVHTAAVPPESLALTRWSSHIRSSVGNRLSSPPVSVAIWVSKASSIASLVRPRPKV